MTKNETNPFNYQVQDVYLYVFRNDKLSVHYGELETADYLKYGRFRKKKASGRHILGKSYQTSKYESECFNKTVWFKEENLEKAKEIFIQYEEDLIQQYQTYIKKCEEKIKLIRESR